ncbi:MAG: serine--tRNA ligase, partial [Candidatus Omnitrophica bacterium]|nr:serine--tRNA ligase [Candidatus Omnitrophota bacterium]
MLDLKFIRDNKAVVKEAIKNRGYKLDIDEFIRLDEEHRKMLTELEDLRAQRNKANDEITGVMKAKGNPKEIIARMKPISQKIADFGAKVEEISQKIDKIKYIIPNIPDKSLPVGGPECNKIVKSWGEKPNFEFKPKTHTELAEILDIICFGVAAKITGSNFILYKGLGARLERALINFMLDLHTKKHGYT